MKRFFALFLALTMTLSLTAFAGEFNAGVAFDTDTDGNTTIEVADSDLFDTQKVTLTVDCALETAYVVFRGQAVTSTLADGKITFSVIDGGIYTIKEGTPSVDELPDNPNPDDPNPDDPNPDNPNPDNPNPGNPDTPDTPDTPSKPDVPSAPAKPPVSSDDEEPQEPQQPEQPQQPQQPSVQPPFGDIKEDDWFYADVAWAYENGLMNGTDEDSFSPTADTSRSMIVTILWRLEGMPEMRDAQWFEDAPSGQWYTTAIAWAASNGIVEGYGNGKFGTNDAITREQFAAILWRYAKYKGYDVSAGKDTNILSYEDAFDISEYAFSALQWACGAGLMNGADGELMPDGNASRAQAATLLHRFAENVK